MKVTELISNNKIAEIYGIDIKWRDFYNYNSPYKSVSFCTEYFLVKVFDIALSSECYLFETILKSGNYSDDDFDFMAEERRQNVQALKEEFKAKNDPIKKQAQKDYLSEQKELQKRGNIAVLHLNPIDDLAKANQIMKENNCSEILWVK